MTLCDHRWVFYPSLVHGMNECQRCGHRKLPGEVVDGLEDDLEDMCEPARVAGMISEAA